MSLLQATENQRWNREELVGIMKLIFFLFTKRFFSSHENEFLFYTSLFYVKHEPRCDPL